MSNQPRKYRPGSRNPKYRAGGRMSENRLAWLRTVVGQFVIMRYEEDDGFREDGEGEKDDNEYGPTVRLVLPRTFGAPMKYNLTALTIEEFRLLRKFFNLLFDLAEPVILERDRIAKNAYESGDDSFARSYREPPHFVVRGRKISADDQSILYGLEDALAGPAQVRDSSGGAGADSIPVVDDDSQGDGAQNDHSEDHQPEGLREMGGDASDSDGLQGTSSSEG